MYVSTVCSKKKFESIFNISKIKPQQQAQKFHFLLSTGLAHHVEGIDFITRPPSEHTEKRCCFEVELEKIDKLTYHYLPILQTAILRYLVNSFFSFVIALKWSVRTRKQERVIACDILNVSIVIPAILVGKIFRIKTLGIVTDLPESYLEDCSTLSFFGKFRNRQIRRLNESFIRTFDYYTLLTEQMNDRVNPRKKPHIVMEGIIDDSMRGIDNAFNAKHKEKVILYAGGLYLKYGIGGLLDAFQMVDDSDARLWLFGDGDAVDKIREIVQQDSRIFYFGIRPNQFIVEEELKSLLLVNPRPTEDEYTKYSFPSKNMEYMVSGTPVVTTKLPGMPPEYLDFVYVFENESVQGMASKLSELLLTDRRQLHAKGMSAKSYVLTNNSSNTQGKRIIDFLYTSMK